MRIFAKIFCIIIYTILILLNKTTYRVFACAILITLCNSAMAQNAVSRITEPVINRYARVTAINGLTVTLDADVSSMFAPADTVLLIQMTGIPQNGNITIYNNAGRYEFHIVTGVNGQDVTLKSAIASNTFDPSDEFVQLVRVPSYKNAVIENQLTCEPWDKETGTGGVLALMVNETLTFNADIDVSGRGFKGGRAYTAEYDGPCSFNDEEETNWPDYPESYLYAGYKGEGAAAKDYFDPNDPNSNLKGYGKTWNGGGGGNGKWSGGGGGANGGYGGVGENQACGAPGYLEVSSGHILHGNDGFAISYGYVIQRERTLMRVFMGGGGGAGTGTGTAGGDGGGIVIIVAQNLHFNPNTAIKANGNPVAGDPPAQAGAGGGGGGGSIFLSVKDYGDIRTEITGGNGGNVYREASCSDNSGNYTRGAGGGGGGGLLFTSKPLSSSWYNNINSFKKTGGNRGEIIRIGVCDYTSSPGEPGISLDNFQVQLRGFLHNYTFTPDTSVCNGVPVTIRASEPKGGTGSYNYEWQSSADGNSWLPIDNTNTPNLLYPFTEDILYVRRVVTSGDVTDIGLHIQVNAYRAIINEIAPADTTFCWKETLTIRENIPTEGGGGGPYTYHWQVTKDNTEDIQTSTPNLSVSLRASGIQTIQRQVISGKGCISDWSEASVIHIQPEITGNTISPENQRVCGDTAGQLTGPVPAGGTGDYNYQWQVSPNTRVDWTDIPNDASDPSYLPGFVFPRADNPELYHDRYFRRYITSGECKSTSNEVMVRYDLQSSPSHITVNDKTGDDALRFLFSEKLYADAPEIGNGVWTSKNGELSFDPPGEPSTTVNNLQIGVNTIYWTVSNGACVSPSDAVVIEVKNIIIPTGFSPNGLNKCFVIKGVVGAESSELVILDRYNGIVFKSNSIEKNSPDECVGWWDGRNLMGKELPSGNYFYRLTLNGNKVYCGYVVLWR